MWTLNNTSPFAAERAWVRDVDGAEVWLVAIRGSFTCAGDGRLTLAEEQTDVQRLPLFRDDNEASSLVLDTDLCLAKVATDVLLAGSALAPGDRPVSALDVRLELAGHIDKTLRVTGDRVWQAQMGLLRASPPAEFTQMPLIYERAAGGLDVSTLNSDAPLWDTRNPVGAGYSAVSALAEGLPLPNLEYPSRPMTDYRRPPAPTGVGPVAGHWAPRVAYAGTYDDQWQRHRHPLLPEDFDLRFYQCAPQDQQMSGFARGGEWLSVTHMCAEGVWRTRLPRVSLWVDVHFNSGRKVRCRPVMHTVLVKPLERRLEVTWHSHLRCHADAFQLREAVVKHKPRATITNSGIVSASF